MTKFNLSAICLPALCVGALLSATSIPVYAQVSTAVQSPPVSTANTGGVSSTTTATTNGGVATSSADTNNLNYTSTAQTAGVTSTSQATSGPSKGVPVLADMPKDPIPMIAPAPENGVQPPAESLSAVASAAATSSAVASAAATSKESPSLIDTIAKDVGSLPGMGTDKTEDQAIDGVVPTDIPGLDLAVEAPKSAEEIESEMRRDAFETMMSGVLPMKPPELRDAFQRMDINQKAIEEPLAYPKPEVSFTTISLDPGATPLTFKLATGHVTTVSFLDVTGQPWPIKDMTWAGNFQIKSSSQEANAKFPMYPNLLQIIPMSEYAYGNLSVRLLGLPTPVTFTLRTNREVVQYRLDLRVPEKGPLAMPSIIARDENTLVAGDRVLTRIMEGVPPSNATKLSVDGGDGRTTAYRLDGVTYVRTPLTLLSPGWNASVKSADGMNVYALGEAPVLLLSDQGAMVRASLSETKGGAE